MVQRTGRRAQRPVEPPAAEPRVAITGLGLITPVGVGREVVWENLLKGVSGIGPVERFDTSEYRVHNGAEIKGFQPEDHIHHLDPSAMGRASQFAVAAARMALTDASLPIASVDPERAGVAMGTTSGEPQEVESFNDCYLADDFQSIDGGFMSHYPCNEIPELVAAELGFGGPNIMIPTACAAGNYAIAYAFDALRDGAADVMLAGGADCFSRITYTGFAVLGAIARDCCRPFDLNRQGMIPGEGAGVLVLEPVERALERGARIYAEITGCGLSCDAHHMTAAHPEGAGAVRAMREALRQSGRAPEDVSYISAHGTGTPTNDRLETVALKKVFGEAAYSTPLSSIKSMLGHTMGAASAIEAAACALAIHDGVVPPTINFEQPDPECDLDCVPNECRPVDVEVAMSNAYAFGGNNASLLVEKFVQ